MRKFLTTGILGQFKPRRNVGPEEIQSLFGAPTEVWPPKEDDRESADGGSYQFPLVISYGDLEFHFSAPGELHCVFADTFCGHGNVPSFQGSIALQDASLLRKDTPMQKFLEIMKAESIEIRSIRHPAPSNAFVTTSGGIEIGFESADAEAADSVPLLKWFCWASK